MRFQIQHESPGRVRLRAVQRSMSMAEADLLEAWILALPGVDQVTVHERICGVTILFRGERDALYRALRENCHIQPEMKAPGYVLLMTSYADSAEGFSRLLSALREIDAAGRTEKASSKKSAALPARSLPSCAMTISGACMAESELIPFADAAGRISGDYVAVFPPDTPLIVPGEIFDEDLISRAEFLLKRGYSLTGCDGGRVRVLVR